MWSSRRIAPPLRATASAPDGTVEGVEDPLLPFVVGVLWHPGARADRRLLEAFVDEAADCRLNREERRVAA